MINSDSDSDTEFEIFEMSTEVAEKRMLVNSKSKDNVSYTDDEVQVGGSSREPTHRKATNPSLSTETRFSGFLLTLSFFAAIGGFLFGYDTGVVSGAMLLLKSNFHLSPFTEEVIVSVTIATAAVFAIVSGFLNEYFGRKLTIVIGSFVFTAGAVVLAVAQNIAMLIAGRAILGIGIGKITLNAYWFIFKMYILKSQYATLT